MIWLFLPLFALADGIDCKQTPPDGEKVYGVIRQAYTAEMPAYPPGVGLSYRRKQLDVLVDTITNLCKAKVAYKASPAGITAGVGQAGAQEGVAAGVGGVVDASKIYLDKLLEQKNIYSKAFNTNRKEEQAAFSKLVGATPENYALAWGTVKNAGGIGFFYKVYQQIAQEYADVYNAREKAKKVADTATEEKKKVESLVPAKQETLSTPAPDTPKNVLVPADRPGADPSIETPASDPQDTLIGPVNTPQTRTNLADTKAGQWVSANKKPIIIGGLVAAGAVGGVLLYKNHQDKKNKSKNVDDGTVTTGPSDSATETATATETSTTTTTTTATTTSSSSSTNTNTIPAEQIPTLEVAGLPSTAKAGTALGVIRVRVVDQFAQLLSVSGVELRVACVGSCSGFGSYGLLTTDGVAEFNGIVLPSTATGVRLRVYAPSLNLEVLSDPFDVTN